MQPLVECVPNFSEGRDRSKVGAIAAAISSVSAVRLLDVSMDPDHHRSVLTFAGPPAAVLEASLAAAATAVERIDLREHAGVHPRAGALDVLPFVPLAGASIDQCAELAGRAGEEIWSRFRVPVYFYEAAARAPQRADLARLRRPEPGPPDIGGPQPHPTAGVVACGARGFLIAFNVNLATTDLKAARRIARRVRASSGGLPCVKAMGVPLASRGLVQVSMNLTDFNVTPMHAAFDAVRSEAARLGLEVLETEIVGLVPRRAWEISAGHDMRIRPSGGSLILEDRLATVK